MKINFDQFLFGLDNTTPIKRGPGDGEPEAPATLGWFATMMLMQEKQSESPQDKLRAYRLLLITNAGGLVELDPADSAFIRDRITSAPGVPPLIAGRVADVLNG